MFKSTYYAGEDDDQQRVSTPNDRDSAYWVEFDDDYYMRVGVIAVDEQTGDDLPDPIISLEVGECDYGKEPTFWHGRLRELKKLLEKDS